MFFVVLWLIAPLSALALAALWLHAPSSDLWVLAQIFIASEILSLVFGWTIYRLSLRSGLASIQLKIALTFALGLGVTLFYVLFVSIPMFISAHDSELLLVLPFFAPLVALGFGQLLSRSITSGLEDLARAAEKFPQAIVRRAPRFGRATRSSGLPMRSTTWSSGSPK